MLRGTLDEFTLQQIFGLLVGSKVTGRLQLQGTDGEGRILFREGSVFDAQSNLGREPLGSKLVRAKVLTDKQLWEALSAQSSGSKIGETLMAEGLVTRKHVEDALEEQIADGVFNVFRLEPKEFAWKPEEFAAPDVAIGMDELMESVKQRLDLYAEIRRQIGHDDLLLALSPIPPEGQEQIPITPEQWRVLALLGSRRAVKDVLHYSGSGDIQTLQALHAMVSNGLIEIVDPGEADAAPVAQEAPPAPPQERTVIQLPDAPRPAPAPPSTFRLVFVCTGNRIRSAMAAGFVRQLTQGLPVEVESFGIQNLGPAPAVAEAVEAAAELGLDLTEHKARVLEPGSLEDADLVIGFEWLHLDRAVGRGGAAKDRSFTLLEFVKLLDEAEDGAQGDELERARLAVEVAARVRSEQRRRQTGLETFDPLGGSAARYRDTAAQIRDLCRRLVAEVFAVDLVPSEQQAPRRASGNDGRS